MKWKYMRLFLSISCCLSLAFFMFTSHINIIKASEFNPNDYVTFGVYSSSEGGIVESSSVRFNEHILYGLTLGIYNYFVSDYGNQSSFPNDFTILRTRLINLLGEDFWSAVVNYRFICNCYRYENGSYNYLILTFNRASFDNGKIFERNVNINDLVTFEILPENYNGAKYLFVKNGEISKIFSVLPYFNRNDLGIATSNYLESTKTSDTITDITSAMASQSVRSFYIRIQVSTPALTFSLLNGSRLLAYYNDETFTSSVMNTNMYTVVPIMTDFPVYTYDNVSYNTNSAFLYAQNDSTVRLYYNRLPNVYISEELSPIILSNYENIPNVTPTPTFTPTPQPTWTPYPTSTPFPPVNEIEGISQMMTLFTRKYEFNINGNVIGIRPLYLFVFTFLVGAIFKAIQGGDRN